MCSEFFSSLPISVCILYYQPQWRTEEGVVGGLKPPPPQIPKALQNRAEHDPIVKTVENCWIYDANTSKMFGKKAVKF